MALGPSNPIFGTVGIAAGAPFTIGRIPYITSDVPPVITASPVMAQVIGANEGIVVSAGAVDPQPGATERLRVSGGAIIQGAAVETVAIGRGAATPSSGAIAIGRLATTAGSNSIAIGQNTTATTSGATAVGVSADATGNNTTAIGQNAQATQQNACAVGDGSAATAVNATAIGTNAAASQAAVAIGTGAIASAAGAVVIGVGPTANAFRTIIVSGAALSARAHEQIWIHAGGSNPNTVGATGGTIFLGGDNGAGVAVTHANNIIIGMNQGSFVANCAVIGGSGTVISTCVIGAGNTSTTQKPLTLRLTNRTGAGNLAGSDFSIQSGAGVGTDLSAGFIALRTPVSAGGGVTQGFSTRMFILSGGGVIIEAPDAAGAGVASLRLNGLTDGVGAAVGTLLNAPTAGDPAFWLPIDIAGTVRYIPCWA